MGVFLIFAILSIISIGLIVVGKIVDYNTSMDGFGFYCVGGGGLIVSVVAMIICGIVVGIIFFQKDLIYKQYELQYQVISAKLEENEINYILFVGEINEYNNAILKDRYWSDNLWVNWYHNGLIKDLPLIGESK